jgi:hypothetical protein
VLYGATVLPDVQLVVSDIGDIFWEPSFVSAFENTDIEHPQPTPDLDTCFEKDTALLDQVARPSQARFGSRIALVSQHLLASIGEPELFRQCKSVFAVCQVPGLSNGHRKQHHVQQGDDHPWN